MEIVSVCSCCEMEEGYFGFPLTIEQCLSCGSDCWVHWKIVDEKRVIAGAWLGLRTDQIEAIEEKIKKRFTEEGMTRKTIKLASGIGISKILLGD